MLKVNLTADTVAVIISCFSLGWNFCRDFVDRARLDFQIDFAPVVDVKTKQILKEKNIIIRFFNKGKNTLCIKKIEGIGHKKTPVNMELLASSSLNRVIEGKNMSAIIIPLEAWKLSSPFKKIIFHTTDDKKYKIPKKQLKRVEKDIADLKEERKEQEKKQKKK